MGGNTEAMLLETFLGEAVTKSLLQLGSRIPGQSDIHSLLENFRARIFLLAYLGSQTPSRKW